MTQHHDERHAESVLALAETFQARVLPALLRRLCAWRGLPSATRADLTEEIRQEVALDCLARSDEVIALDPTARHARWMRLAERIAYQLCVGPERRRSHVPTDTFPSAEQRPADETLPDDVREHARELQHRAVHLQNGRVSMKATGEAWGVHPRRVRARAAELADHLGRGDGYVSFWQRRLVEALAGLAADRLRDEGHVRLWAESHRRRPDPAGQARRIRRIRGMIGSYPLREPVRRAIAAVTGTRAHRMAASKLLDTARMVAPDDPTVLLWRFEAAIAEGDHREAARCLRDARLCGADPVAVVLARARLLEARDHLERVPRLLRRAHRRHGADPRIPHVLHALEQTA